MPRDGSLTLSDIREPTLTIVCERCGRYGRYRVDKLMAEHGDAKLTDLLVALANCKKTRSFGIHDDAKRSSRGCTVEPNKSLWSSTGSPASIPIRTLRVSEASSL